MTDLPQILTDPARLVYLDATGRWHLRWPWGWPFLKTATAEAAIRWLVAWGWSWAAAQRVIVDLQQVKCRRHQETAGGEVRRGPTPGEERHADQVRRWWR